MGTNPRLQSDPRKEVNKYWAVSIKNIPGKHHYSLKQGFH